jgi:hypothetical protein
MFVARLFGAFPFLPGMLPVLLARLEDCEWARERSLAGAEPSPLAARFAFKLSALGSMVYFDSQGR